MVSNGADGERLRGLLGLALEALAVALAMNGHLQTQHPGTTALEAMLQVDPVYTPFILDGNWILLDRQEIESTKQYTQIKTNISAPKKKHLYESMLHPN